MEFVIDEIQTIHSSCTVDLFGETTYAIEIPSNSPLIGDEQRNRIWKYAAHHSSGRPEYPYFDLYAGRKPGIHKHGNSIFMK